MTIKKRLFLSNLLMLVLPIILSVFSITIIMMGITNLMGLERFKNNIGSNYEHAVRALIDKSEDWTQNGYSFEQMKHDLNYILKNGEWQGVSAYILKDTNLLFSKGETIDHNLLDFINSQKEGNLFVVDSTAAYRLQYNEYDVLLFDTDYRILNMMHPGEYITYFFTMGLFMILLVIIIIMLINQFLTRFVIKRIYYPLELLVYGFHQLRDGNLSFRIEYSGKDEFTQVFEDFNNMAQKLLEFVNARQRDEDNRKELIAGISHDLRTPLTSIKAYLEGLEKGVASTPETQMRYLRTIKNKTNDLEQIVNQLFLYSKLDLGDYPFYMEQLDIGKLMTQYVNDSLKEYEQKGLKIALKENTENVMIEADGLQLRNVFTNVLENSVKYKIKELGLLDITCRVDGNGVYIRFIDDGPGISEEAINKIFDVFFRSDPSRSNPGKGSGLGLAISERIIQKMGGRVWAENVNGWGLAINIMIPRSIEEEE